MQRRLISLSSIVRLRRPWLPILLALLATATNAASQQATNSAGYSVRGIVVNSVSGAPVARALVTLNAQYGMLTDAGGQFSFDPVPDGLYMVSVQKPGYLTIGIPQGGHMIGGVSGQELHSRTIHVMGDTSDLQFSLTPAGSISGQITLSGSDPPGAIGVSIYQRQFQNGRPMWVMVGHVITRSDGTFRMGGLGPGSYMVSTHATLDSPGHSGGTRPVWGYPPMYYPGVTDPNSAGILTLAAGQQTEADFTLSHQRFFPVTIAVRSDQEMPAQFQVLDPGGRDTGLNARYSPMEQTASVNVPNGSWILNARGFGRTMSWGRASFQVAGTPARVALTLEQIPRIPVEIHRDFASQNAQTDSSDRDSRNPGVQLKLISADPFNGSGGIGFLSPQQSGEGAGWQIIATEPGRYWVEATPFPPGYVSSITSGGVDLTSNPLIVATGSTPSPIDVTLRDDSGKISGSLTSQNRAASGAQPPGTQAVQSPPVQVCAIPLFASVIQVPVTMAGSDGSFTFADLTPGNYRVTPCDAPQQIDFHSADGLSAWAGKGQVISVTAGGTAQVSLNESGSAGAQ